MKKYSAICARGEKFDSAAVPRSGEWVPADACSPQGGQWSVISEMKERPSVVPLINLCMRYVYPPFPAELLTRRINDRIVIFNDMRVKNHSAQ